MSGLGALWSPAPYHLISYGTLLGTSMYQAFVNGIVAYRALSRPAFSDLQAKLTPVYFTIQTVLPVIIALTYPAPSPSVAGRALRDARMDSSISNGFLGVLDADNRYSVLLPVLGMFITAFANWILLGPLTTQLMEERKEQGRKDGKMSYEAGPRSKQMQALSRKFGILHGLSALTDLIGTGFRLWYGFTLAGRLN